LKKLHNLNKKNAGQAFIGQAAVVTKCPDKKKKVDKCVDKEESNDNIGNIAAKAIKNKKNPEKVKRLAKKAIRKIAEKEDFEKDQKQANDLGVDIKKPFYKEDDEENEKKID